MNRLKLLLIGYAASWFLFGSFLVQLYDYVRAFHRQERLRIRLVVYITSIASILHILAVNYAICGEPTALMEDPTTRLKPSFVTALIPTLNGIIAACVQVFFAWRIYIVGGGRTGAQIISGMVALIAFIQFGASIAVTVIDLVLQYSRNSALDLEMVKAIWLASNLLGDTLISASMMIFLLRTLAKPAKPTPWAHHVHQVLINLTRTSALAAIVSLISFILFFATPNHEWSLPGQYIVGSILANALLASLNGRPPELRRVLQQQYSHNDVALQLKSNSTTESCMYGETLDISAEAIRAYEESVRTNPGSNLSSA